MQNTGRLDGPRRGERRHALPRELIGKIVLARFLEKTPREVEEVVQEVESAPLFLRLTMGDGGGRTPLVRHGRLRGARFLETDHDLSPRVAGTLHCSANEPHLFYRSQALVRQYFMDEGLIAGETGSAGLLDGEGLALRRLVRMMRLVNTRNRLSHAVLWAAVTRQRAFLASLDARLLYPLRHLELASALAVEDDGAKGLDPSRMSRIVRSMSLLLPDGRELPVHRLFPGERSLIEAYLRDVLLEERKQVAAGNLARPFADMALAAKISDRTGLSCSRRTVAYARKGLGIPSWRERAHLGCYLTATENFSELYSLKRAAARAVVPQTPGVYELRLAEGTIDYRMGPCPVFYVGSARNLRKRLLGHLGPGVRNRGIRAHVAGGNVLFRVMCVKKDWRSEERRIYTRFLGTFGEPPRCNKLKP